MQIPQIEPFQFIRSTAFSERVQLANKLNEVIDALNSLGDLPDLESQITELSSKVSELEESIGSTDTSLAELENQVNGLISEVNTTIKQAISALESEVDGIDTRLTTAEETISEHGTEIDGLLKEVVDGVAMTSNPHGTVQVQINHEDGSNDISAPIDLGLVEEGGIVLQSGTTDRSFKLIVTLTDGTSWQTNDFVIPEGGGTDVSVTSISIAQGTGADKIQVKIGLSDGSTISSNDWTVVTPSEFSALGTRVTTAEGNITKNTGDITQNTKDINSMETRVTTAEGNITKNTGDITQNTKDINSMETRVTTAEGNITQNTGDISDLDSRVQALEDSPGYALQPATTATLGGVKIGSGIIVQSDGTISVDKTQINTAAVASTFKFTADASKVTLHADSVAGSEFTKDIPQASQGGAGTIDYASYQKIAANEAAISELEADVAALAPSVSVNEEADPPTITVAVNGKSSTANLPENRGGWEEFEASSLPSDFQAGDIIAIEFYGDPYTSGGKWDSTPSIYPSTPDTENNNPLVFFVLNDSNFGGGHPIAIDSLTGRVQIYSISRIQEVSGWNGSGNMFELEFAAFNGAGIAIENIDVTRANIATYAKRLFRIRN